MTKTTIITLIVISAVVLVTGCFLFWRFFPKIILIDSYFFFLRFFKKNNPSKSIKITNEKIIPLPLPKYQGQTSIEEVIFKRRSVRKYKKESLTLEEISQLLWAAQGITEPNLGLRTVPSAGALYPLEIYIIVGDIIGLGRLSKDSKIEKITAGVYKYDPQNHQLIKILEGDKRSKISLAALGQEWVREAPVTIVIAAVFERTTKKYGQRAERYVYMEAGHAAQNIYLQATALDLGTVTVGAFNDEEVKKIIGLLEKETPLYLMPVGKK